MKRGTDHLRGALVLMGAGVIAFAVAIVGLAISSGGAQAQTPDATYAGDVEVVSATPPQCGGGTISLTLDATGTNIVQIVLDGTYVGGVLVNTVPDPDGPLVIDLAPPIAIAGDGTFDTTFQPLPGLDATFAGTFVGDDVTGTFGVAALNCIDVPFSAVAGAVLPTPTSTATTAATTAPTATVAATALPPTGTGAGSTGSDDGAMLWIALGIIGVVSIAGGALALNRRRA